MKNSILDEMTQQPSELENASELTKIAAKIGFDWPIIDQVFDKMQEELTELKEAIKTGNVNEINDELGDVLFVCANLARHLNLNPEDSLKSANQKFTRRFKAVEKIAQKQFPNTQSYDLDTLENAWLRVKIDEI